VPRAMIFKVSIVALILKLHRLQLSDATPSHLLPPRVQTSHSEALPEAVSLKAHERTMARSQSGLGCL
jgi:hypothetical protein